jgi:hypothetical protein
LGDIRENGKKSFPRPASLSTQCLAEVGNILSNSLHGLYSVISNYLIVMKGFQFNTVPEYVVLFHSADVKHEEHREFLLSMILNGIKDDLDLKLLNSTPLLKMLFGCYSCPLSNRKLNELILKIFNKLVLKTRTSDFLINKYGLISWLFQIVDGLEAYEYETIDIIVEFVENIVNSTDFGKCEEKDKLHLMLVKLLSKFTKSKLSTTTFIKFLKTLLNIAKFDTLQEENLNSILEFVKLFVDDVETFELNYIQKFPNCIKFLGKNNNLDPDNLIEISREIFVKFYQGTLN